MVRVFASFVVLLSTASALATPFKRDVYTVKADIDVISGQVTLLDNSITAFPDMGGTLPAALAIHSEAVALDDSLKKGATDTQGTDPFSEDDGQSILASVEAIEPTILSALKKIVEKKSAFQALPIGNIPALIHQDLKDLDMSAGALANALIEKAPADLVPRANEIRSTLGEGFAKAIAAYE